jgi:hypothetical protein
VFECLGEAAKAKAKKSSLITSSSWLRCSLGDMD